MTIQLEKGEHKEEVCFSYMEIIKAIRDVNPKEFGDIKIGQILDPIGGDY